MRFLAEYRNVYNDVNVSEWRVIEDLEPGDTPLQVYNDLCKCVDGILDVVGFVDAPEWGHIRTGSGYGEATLFQYRDSRDRSVEIFTEFQYRIIEIEDTRIRPSDVSQSDERALALE